jgi:hypothetical protein
MSLKQTQKVVAFTLVVELAILTTAASSLAIKLWQSTWDPVSIPTNHIMGT